MPDEAQINPFFLSMIGHIARAAARRSFDLLMSFQQLSEDWHTDYELSNRADGMILLGYGNYLNYAERLRHLAETDSHFVIWGPVVESQPGHYVCCDNVLGARLAAEHLIRQGRKRIAFAGAATAGSPEFQLRHRGFAEVLDAAGLARCRRSIPRRRASRPRAIARGSSSSMRACRSTPCSRRAT